MVAAVFTTWPAVAGAQGMRFDDPYDIPKAPRPPTLPELTHSEMEATLETTAGALLPNPGGDRTHAYVQRLAVEVPLGLRRWFVGAQYEIGSATESGAFRTVGGNLALDGRTLWATHTGLALGGGITVMLPTAAYDPSGPAAQVALDAASLRPWDVTFFVPGAYGVRPYVDVRALDGPLVVQFRQGLDVTLSTGALADRHFYATAGLYLGWQALRDLAVGLEAFEAYAIQVPGVQDGARSAVIVSPNVRVALPWVQPAISAFTNVGTPLYGAHDSLWGFRLAFTVVYDPSAMLGLKAR
jgi:hypothetical protein